MGIVLIIAIVGVGFFLANSLGKAEKDVEIKMNLEISDMKERIIEALEEFSKAPDFEELPNYKPLEKGVIFRTDLGISDGIGHNKFSKTFNYSIEKFLENKGLYVGVFKRAANTENYSAFFVYFLSKSLENANLKYGLGITIKTLENANGIRNHIISINLFELLK